MLIQLNNDVCYESDISSELVENFKLISFTRQYGNLLNSVQLHAASRKYHNKNIKEQNHNSLW